MVSAFSLLVCGKLNQCMQYKSFGTLPFRGTNYYRTRVVASERAIYSKILDVYLHDRKITMLL